MQVQPPGIKLLLRIAIPISMALFLTFGAYRAFGDDTTQIEAVEIGPVSETIERGTHAVTAAVTCGSGTADVTGTIFRDYDSDGLKDPLEPGVPNIFISAYNDTGLAVQCSTDVNGRYTLTVDAADYPLRLEMEALPAYLQQGAAGADSETSLAFVSGDTAGVDFGVANPDQYCQVNPDVAMSCYENGSGAGNTNYGFISVPYTSTGDSVDSHVGNRQIQELGSVWGAAYQQEKSRLFSTSFLKRHVGFANSPGHIYVLDYSMPGVPIAHEFSLEDDVPDNLGDDGEPIAGTRIRLGDVCRQSTTDGNSDESCDPYTTGLSSDYTLPITPTQPSVDLDAFAKIGTISYGSADVDDNTDTLWVVNLNSKALISVDVSGETATLPGPTNQYKLEALSGSPTCNNGEYRPWAVAIEDQYGYVGGVCSGENGGDETDLFAFVHRFDPSNVAIGLTEVVSFSLDYNREEAWQASGDTHHWEVWADEWSDITPRVHPQAILSDIDFTHDGSMVIALADRFSHQVGHDNYNAESGSTTINSYASGGDIIHACAYPGGFLLEGTTDGAYSCDTNEPASASMPSGDTPGNKQELNDGPSGAGEFYPDDYFKNSHTEVSLGGVATVRGQNEVLSIVYDPWATIRTNGIHRYSTLDGSIVDAYQIVDFTASSFGKAGGLGEPEFICDAAPIEIGNRVWVDMNRDGVQDPSEPGLAGVTIALYDSGGSLLATDTTDGDGSWGFTSLTTAGLTPNSNFTVGILDSNTDLGGTLHSYENTVANTNPDGLAVPDVRDADGLALPSTVGSGANESSFGIVITTGSAGHNDHRYDFGVYEPLRLGNQVWHDADNNGQINGAEAGIDNVIVNLLDSSGNPVLDPVTNFAITTTTSAGGYYTFTNLISGTYIVEIDASNFVTTGPLVGYASSDPNQVNGATGDDDDNGINEVSGAIRSNPVSLAPNNAPTGEGEEDGAYEDNHSDLTIDFGFYEPLRLGNQVWYDTDNNGQINGAEAGVDNVIVNLLDNSGNPILDPVTSLAITTTTSAGGFYTFTNLISGTYIVEIDASNFVTTGPLVGYASSDPNQVNGPTGDDDDNGVNEVSGAIRSNPISLTPNNAPTGEGEENGTIEDNHSDLTIDFGFTEVVEIGNRVWFENDHDGLASTGVISPVVGVIVKAINANGNVYSDTTDLSGLYTITVPANTTYTVTVQNVPAGFTPSVPSGGFIETDSDPNSNNDTSHRPYGTQVTVGSEDNYTIDFGYHQGVQIGNRVWIEDDNDGDASTGSVIPVVGTVVTATASNGTVFTATTDSSGLYTITVPANATYTVTTGIPSGTIPAEPVGGLIDTDNDPSSDNDTSHQPVGTVVDVTTIDNFTIDFGFYPPMRLGNVVWHDVSNDGIQNVGENPIEGVIVELLDQNGAPVVDPFTGLVITTTTNISGHYTFGNLFSGTYIVNIPAENFNENGDPLYGYVSSQNELTVDPVQDPDSSESDSDDNGINNRKPHLHGIRSYPITLELNGEPTTDSSDEDGLFTDTNSNLTVDFGFFELMSLGNRVWFDPDDNGSIGIGEVGVGSGVVLNLLDENGDPVLDIDTGLPITTTTDPQGYYRFINLYPNTYRVQIAPENFQSGGPLEGFASSTGSNDPDKDIDSDDNGVDVQFATLSGITSEPVVLTYNSEPAGGADGDNNDNTNLSIDFGLVAVPTAVELVSFTASTGANQVTLQWQTASEVDNFGFRILRSQSSDANSAAEIHFEPSTVGTGAGDSYSFTESGLADGTHYYWLVDVETNGAEAIHGPVAVNVTSFWNLFLPSIIE